MIFDDFVILYIFLEVKRAIMLTSLFQVSGIMYSQNYQINCGWYKEHSINCNQITYRNIAVKQSTHIIYFPTLKNRFAQTTIHSAKEKENRSSALLIILSNSRSDPMCSLRN